MPTDPDKELADSLIYNLGQACQRSSPSANRAGWRGILDLPRDWALRHLEPFAERELDLEDEWEYRRLLEVCALLDRGLLERFIRRGLTSANPEVREAAAGYLPQPV
jgi:hypothetical protein